MNAEFQRKAQDKEKFWTNQCREIEEASRKGHTRALYAQVKNVRSPFCSRKGTIKDKEGKELNDQSKIRERWREYADDLFSPRYQPQETSENKYTELELCILQHEVEWAIKQLPNRKAAGADGIPAELFKPVSVVVLTKLCQEIWNSGQWPKDWKRSVFIPIPKKRFSGLFKLQYNCSNSSHEQNSFKNHSKTSPKSHRP